MESRPTDAAMIAKLVKASITDEDYAAALERLRRSPYAALILEELAKHRDLEVRGWVPDAARELLGTAAVPLIKRMLRDRDADIRGFATDALEELDPKLLDAMLPALRRKLESAEPYEVITTGWLLLQRRDLESVGRLERFRDRYEAWEAFHKMAEVILLALTAPDEVAQRIRDHDHVQMGWLAYAAILVGRPDAIEALRECAANGPDEECRYKCTAILTNELPRVERRRRATP